MSGVVLRLEGLPFKVTEEEIREFFTETEAKIENLHLLLNRDQRPSGIGFIELESEADLKAALTLDGKCIGDSKRYVRMGN
jgi:RNA recognition motif-containing protein